MDKVESFTFMQRAIIGLLAYRRNSGLGTSPKQIRSTGIKLHLWIR